MFWQKNYLKFKIFNNSTQWLTLNHNSTPKKNSSFKYYDLFLWFVLSLLTHFQWSAHPQLEWMPLDVLGGFFQMVQDWKTRHTCNLQSLVFITWSTAAKTDHSIELLAEFRFQQFLNAAITSIVLSYYHRKFPLCSIWAAFICVFCIFCFHLLTYCEGMRDTKATLTLPGGSDSNPQISLTRHISYFKNPIFS